MRIFLEHSTINKFSVVYVDYGNWNDVDSTDIYPIQQKFTTLAAQAIPCSLHKVNRVIIMIVIY